MRFATSNVLRAAAPLILFYSLVAGATESSAASIGAPVVYGGVEIMVPAYWVVFDGDVSGCAPAQVMVLVNGAKEDCKGNTGPKGLVTFGRETLSLTTSGRTLVHGLNVRTSGLDGTCGGRFFTIEKFNAQLVLCGAANSDRTIEDSIRVAPRVEVTAKGALLSTPATWRWSTFDGLRFATPSTWPVNRPVDIGCPWLNAYASTSTLDLIQPGNSDPSCPGPLSGHSDAAALIIGGRPFQSVRSVQHLSINAVQFAVFRDAYADASGVLDLRAKTRTGSTFVRFTFKERDSGKVDREILDSMHLI